MILNAWQLLLVVSAIAIGWLLGRWGQRNDGVERSNIGQTRYYKGLNYLLDGRSGDGLDSFIASLDVNAETLETHIAVGNLMRRKGEVEQAIRIHQNLLARPDLDRKQLNQAHLELARDFIYAGLLDRAERLLKDLLGEAPELRQICMRHLLEIYQDEREWQKAIDTAKQLLPKKSLLKPSIREEAAVVVALAHYCCEQAELFLDKNDYHSARLHLKQALGYDRNCVRASLLLAKTEMTTGHYERAIKSLHRIRQQDPAFVPDSIPLLKDCYHAMGSMDGFHYDLLRCLGESPSVSIMLTLVDDLYERKGEEVATQFIGDELKRRPSLRGLRKLIDLHMLNSDGRYKDNLSMLQSLIGQLMEGKPQYRCQRCGFSGKQIHWLCPSCKQWGQIKLIRGVEGD